MKKIAISAAIGLLCVVSAATAAAAQRAYPTRPVTIVVPAAAGTGADIVTRLISQKLAQVWGQPVVVENKEGASGNLGAAIVAKAPADGYTLCMAFANHTVSPSLYSNTPFDILKDFKPIVRTAIAPMALVANPSFAPNSVPELIALAKSRSAADGIFFGSPGMASINGLALEMLKQRAGISMTQTPFKSNAQMLTDIMGNQIPLGAAVIASALPQIKAGRLKALAVTSKTRSSSLPDVPTVAEAGFAGYDVSAWNGLLAPSGTPDSVIEEIYTEVAKIAQSAAFKETLAAQGMEAAVLGPADFGKYMSDEVAQWRGVVNVAGIKVQ